MIGRIVRSVVRIRRLSKTRIGRIRSSRDDSLLYILYINFVLSQKFSQLS